MTTSPGLPYVKDKISRGYSLVKLLNHFVQNQECITRNYKKSHEIESVESSVVDFEEGSKSHEIITLKSYENDSYYVSFTEITQNYVQSMIS